MCYNKAEEVLIPHTKRGLYTMSSVGKEITVIRELAKQYMEIAVSDKHVRMRQRFRDTNDLKIVRPPVLIDELNTPVIDI